MSSSSINVQIAAVRDTFGAGPAILGVVAAAFLIAFAGLLPAAGRLVDVRGGRPIFLLGVAVFGVGCIVAGTSVSGIMLIAGRFIQGAGAALSSPAALALITRDLAAGATRNRAVAIYGTMGAAGFSLGLVLPGFVVSSWGWRASFWVLLPAVLLVLAVALRIRPDRPGERQRVDVGGAALLTAALLIAVHGLGAIGSLPPPVSIMEAVAVAALIVVLARRGGIAGFPARLVGTPRVLGPCVALASIFAGAIASYYVLSLALQAGAGYQPHQVGLALLPNPVAFALLAGFGARLVTRFGAIRVLGAGLLLITAALGFLGGAGLDLPPLLGMLPAQVAIGAGLALAFPAASICAVDATAAEFRGTTAGLLTTWQNVGGAIGLALVTALGVVPAVTGSTAAAPGLYAAAAFVLIGGLLAAAIGAWSRLRAEVRP